MPTASQVAFTDTEYSPARSIALSFVWNTNKPSFVSTSQYSGISKSKSNGSSTENFRVVTARFARSFLTPKGSPICSRISKGA